MAITRRSASQAVRENFFSALAWEVREWTPDGSDQMELHLILHLASSATPAIFKFRTRAELKRLIGALKDIGQGVWP